MWKAKEFEDFHSMLQFLNQKQLAPTQFKIAAASGNTACKFAIVYWEEEKKSKGPVGFVPGQGG